MSDFLKSTRSQFQIVLGNIRPSMGDTNLLRSCLMAALSFVIWHPQAAKAQAPTATTLTVTSAGTVSGSIVTMTANVSSAGQPVTGGTVTFRDTFGGAEQDLGTVQVQSANGTAGQAVLKTEVGG